MLRFALQLGPLVRFFFRVPMPQKKVLQLFAASYARQIPHEQSLSAANAFHCSIGIFALLFAVLLPANSSDHVSFSKFVIALLG